MATIIASTFSAAASRLKTRDTRTASRPEETTAKRARALVPSALTTSRIPALATMPMTIDPVSLTAIRMATRMVPLIGEDNLLREERSDYLIIHHLAFFTVI